MANLQEIARLVREELLTLIRPVQLLSVNPSKNSGEVSGRFRSNGVLFDYSIGGGTVRYRPVGSKGAERSDAAELLEQLTLSRKAKSQERWLSHFAIFRICRPTLTPLALPKYLALLPLARWWCASPASTKVAS